MSEDAERSDLLSDPKVLPFSSINPGIRTVVVKWNVRNDGTSEERVKVDVDYDDLFARVWVDFNTFAHLERTIHRVYAFINSRSLYKVSSLFTAFSIRKLVTDTE